jgi:hypothetical protein
MTRKAINLDLATREWMDEKYSKRPMNPLDRLLSQEPSEWREKEIQREIARWFLMDKLDIGIDRMGEGVSFTTNETFDRKSLNRLMNCEIAFQGATYVFGRLEADGYMSGDTYMGEYSEIPVHRIEVSFTKK